MNGSPSPSSDPALDPASGGLVQFDAATYVDQTAALLGLALPPSLRAGVIANFEHIHTIAQAVTDFSLPETVESAATFEP